MDPNLPPEPQRRAVRDDWRYSPSSINTFLSCQAAWEFRYLDRVPERKSWGRIRGTAVDEVATTNGRQKIASRVDMPEQDLLDVASTIFDREAASGEILEDPEEKPGEVKDETMEYARGYRRAIAPAIQPIAVQHGFHVAWDNVPYTLSGRMDLVDDHHRVRDLKTTNRTPKHIEGPNRLQLSAYSLGHLAEFGSLPASCHDDTIVVLKTETKIVPLSFEPTPADLRLVETTVANVHLAVKAGAFAPNRGSWFCSRRQCSFFVECEKRFGGKVKP